MTSRSSIADPFAVARFERKLFERARRTYALRTMSKLVHTFQVMTAGVVRGIRLLRTAPPLGDVGTRGGDLTAWSVAWNRQENPRDFSRE